MKTTSEPMTNDQLTEIVEAWNSINPLARQTRFDTGDFTSDCEPPFRNDVAAYLVLAANHADHLAAEVLRLREERERVRAILANYKRENKISEQQEQDDGNERDADFFRHRADAAAAIAKQLGMDSR